MRLLVRHAKWINGLGLFLAGFVIFFPVLQGEFLGWDDTGLFVENPYFRGLSPKHWQWMCTTFLYGHWQPLTWLSCAMDYKLWGLNPFGWHLTNLLIHAVNAVLVYLLCLAFLQRRQSEKKTLPALTGTPPTEGIFRGEDTFSSEGSSLHGRGGRNGMTGREDFLLESPPLEGCPEGGAGYYAASALAALFWAVHPLRVEAVAWLATRGYLLCTTFCLLTVLFYVWRGHPCLRIRAGRDACPAMYLAALLCFTLATFTKGIGMMLPLVLLLIDGLKCRTGILPVQTGWKPVLRSVAQKIPFFALSVLTGITAFLAKKHNGGMAPVEIYGPVQRIGQAVYGLWFYLLKTVSPQNLSPLYDKRPEVWQVLPALTLTAAAGVFLFLFRRKLRPIIGTSGAFLLLIFPMLGITQSGAQLFADRFTYLAAIPFSVLLAVGLGGLRKKIRMVCSASAVLLVCFGVQTLSYSAVWSSGISLWSYAVRLDADSALAHDNMGLVWLEKNLYDKALASFDRAIRLDPSQAAIRHNRAVVLAQMGRYETAVAEWEVVLKTPGGSFRDKENVYLARGWVLARTGDFKGAERDYTVIADDVSAGTAHRLCALQLRAAVRIQCGRRAEAEEDLRQMLLIPDFGGYHERARFALNGLKKIPGE